MQIAWLPPDAPLTRNQLRFAPQASAASRCARWKGVSSGSGPMSRSSVPAGKSSLSAFSPSASTRPAVGSRSTLVAGDVEAADVS